MDHFQLFPLSAFLTLFYTATVLERFLNTYFVFMTIILCAGATGAVNSSVFTVNAPYSLDYCGARQSSQHIEKGKDCVFLFSCILFLLKILNWKIETLQA